MKARVEEALAALGTIKSLHAQANIADDRLRNYICALDHGDVYEQFRVEGIDAINEIEKRCAELRRVMALRWEDIESTLLEALIDEIMNGMKFAELDVGFVMVYADDEYNVRPTEQQAHDMVVNVVNGFSRLYERRKGVR